MKYSTCQLYEPQWNSKIKELIKAHSYKCPVCKNYNLLKSYPIGYLQKANHYGTVSDEGKYINESPFEEFSVLKVKASDDESRAEWSRGGISDVRFRNNIQLNLSESKFYIIYFKEWSYQIHDSLCAIAEIDNPEVLKKWDYEYDNNEANPFRKKPFISNAKFIYVKELYLHHLAFIKGLPLWSYPKQWYQCICHSCLEEVRETRKTKYLDNNGRQISELTICSNCLGQGVLYKHQHPKNNGLCYNCKGYRYEEWREISF